MKESVFVCCFISAIYIPVGIASCLHGLHLWNVKLLMALITMAFGGGLVVVAVYLLAYSYKQFHFRVVVFEEGFEVIRDGLNMSVSWKDLREIQELIVYERRKSRGVGKLAFPYKSKGNYSLIRHDDSVFSIEGIPNAKRVFEKFKDDAIRHDVKWMTSEKYPD